MTLVQTQKSHLFLRANHDKAKKKKFIHVHRDTFLSLCCCCSFALSAACAPLTNVLHTFEYATRVCTTRNARRAHSIRRTSSCIVRNNSSVISSVATRARIFKFSVRANFAICVRCCYEDDKQQQQHDDTHTTPRDHNNNNFIV